MSVLTINQALSFKTVSCYACGITFALPAEYYNDRLDDKKSWFCPNGHQQHFIGETEAQKLQKRLDAMERSRDYYQGRNTHLQDQLQAAKRHAAALKGALTKARKRMGAGVCPVPECHRSFPNLAAHMETKHKDYVVADA